jgi:hypothetical protein
VLAVGAEGDSSVASGVDANQSDTTAVLAGAAYLFARSGVMWSQQHYIKASNARMNAQFGNDLALSGDGATLIAGAPYESSNATGLDGNQADTSMVGAGAAYVFAGTALVEEAYVKAGFAYHVNFGASIAIGQDAILFGAPYDASASTGVDGDATDTSSPQVGAVWLYE